MTKTVSAVDVNTLPNQTDADRVIILSALNGIIWSVINRGTDSLDADGLDDLHSRAVEAANRAIVDYRADGGATIATLVVRYVTQARRDYMRSIGKGNDPEHNKQSTFEHSAERLDVAIATEEEPAGEWKRAALQSLEITLDMAQNDGVIDDREYRIMGLWRGGWKQREIGETVGVCPQRVHQIISNAVRKIRKQYKTAE